VASRFQGMLRYVTPNQKNIVKSLVAVAWADGKVEALEDGVIQGLLCGFDATEAEEQELMEYARARRSLADDVPLAELRREDRELVLANAALITHADGAQTQAERELLYRLSALLGFSEAEASAIVRSALSANTSWGAPAAKEGNAGD
jgi:tellurite resistance protein